MSIDGSQRRQRLRRATQVAHTRLDALITDAGFLENRQQYRRYLEATWTARKPVELSLDASDAATLYAAWPERSVCDALSQDIDDITPNRPVGPHWGRPSAPLSPGQMLGILYVLEGSALGAQLLEQRVAAIGMTPAFGARHMARQTSQPRGWTEFVAVLENTKLDPQDDALCMDAAVDTFDSFESAFRAVI